MSKHPEKSAPQAEASGAQAPSPVEAGEDVARLRAELATKDARIDELVRAYSSLLNDQKDFRVRLEREKDRVLESERGKIALHLLKVGDEIDLALAAAKDDQGPLAHGVKLIHEGLGKTLAQLGLERLSLLGTAYDPNLAEVVDVVAVGDAESDGKVVAEVAAGYRVGERVVRAARVRVGRCVPCRVASEEPEEGASA